MVILGNVLERGHSLEIPAEIGLGYISDSNVKVTFSELDREDLMQLEPKLVLRLCKGLGDITTHEEMCRLLLPAKAKAKKPLLKGKKSSLKE
tara:strand:- start:162 stop:437 length:276 start_codon:yes stop_codon:yes gene_type:complete